MTKVDKDICVTWGGVDSWQKDQPAPSPEGVMGPSIQGATRVLLGVGRGGHYQ